MKRYLLLFGILVLVIAVVVVAHGLITGKIEKPNIVSNSERANETAEPRVDSRQASETDKPRIDSEQTGGINKPSVGSEQASETSNLPGDSERIGQQLSNGKCVGRGPGVLSRSAMKPEDFNMIIPYGLMTGGHVTPIDHQYYSPASYNSPRDAYPVYAMGDARLVLIEHRTEQPQDNDYVRTHQTDEYRLVFSQSCTFFYYYDLLTSLTPELTDAFNQASRGRRTAGVDIPVAAGQLIGRIGGQTLDFAVWDATKPLDGFAVPEHYWMEPWKLYTADPLDYYTPELKQFMLSRYPRVDEPLSGRIDWDIDGALQGTWFLKGTDYSGDTTDRAHYWKTHLAFAPDLYDPSHFVISIGDYGGVAEQFNAKGNRPNPSEVNAGTGLVKYELVKDFYAGPDGAAWDQMSFIKGPKLNDSDAVLGTVLVRLIGPRELKFEVFPGKSAGRTGGFTANAKIYTR